MGSEARVLRPESTPSIGVTTEGSPAGTGEGWAVSTEYVGGHTKVGFGNLGAREENSQDSQILEEGGELVYKELRC